MNDNFSEFKKKIQQNGGNKPVFESVNPQNRASHAPGKTREEDVKYKRVDDKGDAKRNRNWNALLRLGALGASLLGMYISAQFSVDGFSFNLDNRQWIGWGLAVILVVLESVWQKFGGNLTLFALAICCYAYGIITNVLGILGNRGGYDGNPLHVVVPIVFGILLEVFPEPVLAWSISGDITSDPLRKAIEHIGN